MRALLAVVAGASFTGLAGPAGAQPAQLLADIRPGSADGGPFGFTAAGPNLYFTATDGSTGYELWKTDGTTSGTQQVIDLVPGPNSPGLYHMIESGGRLIFSAAELPPFGLYITDGTAGGTRQLTDHTPGPLVSDSTTVAKVNDTVFFATWNPFAGGPGGYLWKTDGTPGGTLPVQQFDPSYPYATWLTPGQSRLFFVADLNPALWTSDGSGPGTFSLGNFYLPGLTSFCPPLPCPPTPQANPVMVAVGDTLFFVVDELVGSELHLALWKSDGSFPGTMRLQDVGRFWSAPFTMARMGSTLYLTVEGPTGRPELWQSDGTVAGTTQVSDLSAVSTVSRLSDLTVAGGTLYFVSAGSGTDRTLWRSDGTPGGTATAASFQTSAPAVTSYNLTDVGGTLFFTAFDTCHGNEPWRSDGTAAGTVRAADIYPGTTGSDPYSFGILNGALYMNAKGAGVGRELWKIDPSGAPAVDACGNGRLDPGEQCDAGAANGSDGSCCACDCTLPPAGTSCCLSSTTLGIRKLGGVITDDALSFSIHLTTSTLANLDPSANGVELQIRRGDSSLVADLSVPGGSWRVRRHSYRFRDRTPGPGIKRAGVGIDTVHGRVLVTLRATGVTASMGAGDPPLTVLVNPGYPSGGSGMCGPFAFATDKCRFTFAGRRLTCKRPRPRR